MNSSITRNSLKNLELLLQSESNHDRAKIIEDELLDIGARISLMGSVARTMPIGKGGIEALYSLTLQVVKDWHVYVQDLD